MKIPKKQLPPLRELMPHQQEAFDKYFRMYKHPALFMRMRLGKTLLAIRWVKSLRLIKNVLVACPGPVIREWEKELKLEREEYIRFWSLPTAKKIPILEENWDDPNRKWFLSNYETIRVSPGLVNLNWDVVIADEGKIIANTKSFIGQLFVLGFRETRHRCLLNGMPFSEHELELFNQMKFLDGHFLGHENFWKYRHAFFQKYDNWNWSPKPGTREKLKVEIHKRAFVKTRRDAGMKESWTHQVRRIEMSDSLRRIYKDIEYDFAFQIEVGKEQLSFETKYAPVQYIWLLRLCGGFSPTADIILSRQKINELIALLEGELCDEKVVIWFHFKKELEEISNTLTKRKIEHVNVYGDVKSKAERDRRLDVWNKDKNVKFLLATESIIKYGVDCSVADTEIYYSNDPSYAIRAQSKERIYHPKKKTNLLCIDLVMADTVDEDMVDLLNEKGMSEKMFMMRMADRFEQRRYKGVSTRG